MSLAEIETGGAGEGEDWSDLALTWIGLFEGVRDSDRWGALTRDMWRTAGDGGLSFDEVGRIQAFLEPRRPVENRWAKTRAPDAPGKHAEAQPRRPVENRCKKTRAVGGLVKHAEAQPRRPGPEERRAARARREAREARRFRRRCWGGSSTMPPRQRALYSEGERAALAAIANTISRRDPGAVSAACDLCIDAIAAVAGVCRTTVQNALRAARRLGHLRVQERRRPGRRSATNLVWIACDAWRAWLRRGGRWAFTKNGPDLGKGGEGSKKQKIEPDPDVKVKRKAARKARRRSWRG
ncbi:hypothetical protein [uncultured Amaricoccus sp.]|uniref:hypothetical protein n=1 Tax=uncultured Amaricoccus sp. TaxID=339341 RepID=UPI00262638BB|nr:hypothetical protein [uncultured Amaricoccus sp.]